MNMKKIFLATLAGTALLAAAPAFADNGRGGHWGNHFQGHPGDHFQGRPVVVHRPAYGYYGYRPAVVYRPAYGYYAPRQDILGGLIIGTVIGAAIASQY